MIMKFSYLLERRGWQNKSIKTKKGSMNKFFYILFCLFVTLSTSLTSQTIELNSQTEVDAFSTSLTFVDNLEIRSTNTNDPITDLSNLSNLTEVGTSLKIRNNEDLTSLLGLHNVNAVGSDLTILGNPSLTDLTGLYDGLLLVGTLDISLNNSLVSLNGIEDIQVGHSISISSNENLVNLTPFYNISTLTGDLFINNNVSLVNVLGLDNLVLIDGMVSISGNPELFSLQGLESLTEIGGLLNVQDNTSLADCCILESLLATPEAIGGAITIANNSFPCNSTSEIEIESCSIDSICLHGDCVFPGDTDRDFEVSNFDVLPIGYRYGATGEIRPNASLNWEAQYCPNWETLEPTSLFPFDFKHTDADGDGEIGKLDLDAIHQNYNLQHNGIAPLKQQQGEGGSLYLAFHSADYPLSTETETTVWADIILGEELENDIQALHGIAFSIEYPSNLVKENSVEVFYDENSWFGPAEQMLDFSKDLYIQEKVDIAFSRQVKDPSLVGKGIIGTIKFVIDEDLIGKSFEEWEFIANVSRIKAINAMGEEVSFEGKNASTTLSYISSSDELEEIENAVQVFPTIVYDELNITIDGFDRASIEIFNAFGQGVVGRKQIVSTETLRLDHLSNGVYFVRIYIGNHFITRKVIIEKSAR